MPFYVVKQGDCLTQIASRHGFADPSVIHSHPENAKYFSSRKNPNVLFPGDRIFVPERTIREESRTTGKLHRFVARKPSRKLHIVLKRGDETPIVGVPYRLVIGTLTFEGKSAADGSIQETIPVETNAAVLELDGMPIDLDIGHLDPMFDAPDDGISGVQARLANLGFVCPLTGALDDDTRSAIARYRRKKRLTHAEGLDDVLKRSLESDHGS